MNNKVGGSKLNIEASPYSVLSLDSYSVILFNLFWAWQVEVNFVIEVLYQIQGLPGYCHVKLID